jgi:hypothetical protein
VCVMRWEIGEQTEVERQRHRSFRGKPSGIPVGRSDERAGDESPAAGGVQGQGRQQQPLEELIQSKYKMVEAAGIESLNGDSQCFAKSGFQPHKHCQFFAFQIFVKRQHCEEKRTKLVSNCLQKLTALMAFHLSSCRRAVEIRLLAELFKTIKRNIFCSISDKRVGGFRN